MKQVHGVSDLDEGSPLLSEKNKRNGIINVGTSTPEERKGSG